jgi:hypothetical protein
MGDEPWSCSIWGEVEAVAIAGFGEGSVGGRMIVGFVLAVSLCCSYKYASVERLAIPPEGVLFVIVLAGTLVSMYARRQPVVWSM